MELVGHFNFRAKRAVCVGWSTFILLFVGLLKPSGLKIMCEKSVSTKINVILRYCQELLPDSSSEQGWLSGLIPVPYIFFNLDV